MRAAVIAAATAAVIVVVVVVVVADDVPAAVVSRVWILLALIYRLSPASRLLFSFSRRFVRAWIISCYTRKRSIDNWRM